MNMMNKTMLSIALDMVLEQGRCPDCLSAIELEKETGVFETLNFTGFQQECGVCGGVLNVTVRLKGPQIKGEVLCNGEEWHGPFTG